MITTSTTITTIMGGDVTGPDSCNVPGPGHSKSDRSLSVRINRADPLGFTVYSFAGDNWQICRDYVATALGLSGLNSGIHEFNHHRPMGGTSVPLRFWTESIPAPGTLAEKYLTSRRLSLPDRHESALRFHPSCPFGKGTRQPCMVALFRDIRTNEPKAIHRTALTPEGAKIDRKVMGLKAGCAIKLTPDEDVAEGLTIAEGIETALAGMTLNFKPAWALGDAGALARFPVLSGIESLSVLVDNDASGTGQASALECSRRWTSAGREVFRVLPTAIGTDMADVVSGKAA
jgi:putative DNA primase/helicase